MPELVLDGEAIGRSAAAQWMQGVRERMRDLRPAWPGVLGVIYRNEVAVFDAEGSVDGEPKWAENSDNPIRFHGGLGYRTYKEQTYAQTKILTLTGKLRRMVTGVTPNGKITPYLQRLRFGTDYRDFSALPKRPRSKRDRLTGDLGGINNNERPGRPYDAHGLGGQLPAPAREIFRIMQSSSDEIADLLVDHVTGTHDSWRRR
jgi:hypothetical protein